MSRRPPSPHYLIAPWQSKTDGVLARSRPPLGAPAAWTLALMVAVLGGIAPFLEIDRTVSSSAGRVVAKDAMTTFQALDPSIIRSVDVREGEVVRQGQLLATLDPTFAAADVDGLRRQMAGLDALIARARAEQTGASVPPAAEGPARDDPYARVQVDLFAERAAQLRAQLASFDERIGAAQAAVAKVQADIGHVTDRVGIAKRIEGMRDTLYKSGSTSLLNLLQANDTSLEMERSLENDRNAGAELQHQIASLRSDRDSAVQQWFAASSQELIAAENQRDTARALLDKALKHQDLVRLVAPKPSVVLTLTKLSEGSVLKQGDPVMTLMPVDAPVEAEIRLAAADIGFVRPGDAATLKFDAFNYVDHGTAAGRLEWISEGAFSDDDQGKPVPPFYRARVAIEKAKFVNVPSGFRLIPGMTLQADIDVGKRSLFQYAASTLLHHFAEAMREP